ncbi:MAG: hypothetical protein HW390_1373 [Candidatus Brocadiaceae bacterium]|nr:hypothetical protein [Candidatus Brocadiaceae bacterium]
MDSAFQKPLKPRNTLNTRNTERTDFKFLDSGFEFQDIHHEPQPKD